MRLSMALLAGLLPAPAVHARDVVKVCVDVQVKSWTDDPAAHSPDSPTLPASGDSPASPAPSDDVRVPTPAEVELGPATPDDPFRLDPARYLKRLVEYEVTHEVGYTTTDTDCAQRLTVELYPLELGWTVFGRFTATDREEKIDRAQVDEFGPLAQRLATALLRDEPIADTITRQNVLRADSEARLRAIEGRGHLMLALGTDVRTGSLPTATGGSGAAEEERRILTPISVQLGYRGKFQAWAVDAFGRASLGTQETAPRRNEGGGHADFQIGGALGLHFLRYLDPPGMTSFYLGGGAAFELSWFSIIQPEAERDDDERERLLGGGLNLDLIAGYEFMRASSLHFFVQAEAHLPTYRIDTETDAGGIEAWMPGGLLQVGILF